MAGGLGFQAAENSGHFSGHSCLAVGHPSPGLEDGRCQGWFVLDTFELISGRWSCYTNSGAMSVTGTSDTSSCYHAIILHVQPCQATTGDLEIEGGDEGEVELRRRPVRGGDGQAADPGDMLSCSGPILVLLRVQLHAFLAVNAERAYHKFQRMLGAFDSSGNYLKQRTVVNRLDMTMCVQ